MYTLLHIINFKERARYSSLSESEYRDYKISGSAYRVNHGADRNRTDGLRLAKAALSQLSYSPTIFGGIGSPWWA